MVPLKPPSRPLPPFVPFLPHDNDALSDPTAAAVVNLLNERLASLLAMPALEFWQHVAHDASLRRALDTYLQFRRRPHDPKPVTMTNIREQDLSLKSTAL